MRTDLDIGARNPETKRFLGFFFSFFRVRFNRRPLNEAEFGVKLNETKNRQGV